jgi:hypothetical protein
MKYRLWGILLFSAVIPFSFAKGVYVGNPQTIEKALQIQKAFDEVILNLKGLRVAGFPRYTSLRVIEDGISLHPLYTTTILFEGYKVLSAQSSFQPKFFQTYKNAVVLQPDWKFRSGSLDILLENEKGKQVFVKLLVHSVDPRSEVFYPYWVIVDRPILSPSRVVEYYYKLFKHLPEKETEIFIDGITYFIKPAKEGNVSLGGRTYTVGVRKLTPSP